ncbi:2-C-methyl-D-erythritol 4-phosphate cytidylyltransferase [Alteromonadaceae bacterium M269]|nr:2-C-methyl-D-erythritol 4-phosphate cytidylyltransferase [Alteromonadaceae bacterium M269]
MSKTASTYFSAIVPAAGVGKRMGANIPKQYLQLAGKTLLEHTLSRLISHPQINQIILVLGAEDNYFDELPISSASWIKRVEGGKERADSVLAGLRYLLEENTNDNTWALVHDAARPCVRHDDISKLLELSEGESGGILATRVRDTMKRSFTESSQIKETVDRENLWHALTPQFFPAQALYDALESGLASGVSITDEASAMEQINYPVTLIESSASNLKVTHPDDLKLAEFYLTETLNKSNDEN